MMDVTLLKQLLEIGWPALVTVAFVILGREYMLKVTDEIQYLRKRIDDLEARTDKVEKAGIAAKLKRVE